MDDRELLELAAKAAGMPPIVDANGVFNTFWNPLTDDGDAFRLAVKLGLSVTVFAEHVGIGCRQLPDGKKYEESSLEDDPCVATRRAIVRTAAEIGKTM